MESNELREVIIEAVVRARPFLGSDSSQQILNMKISDLALDSLDVTTLSLDVEDACRVVIEPEDFSRCETLSDLHDLVSRRL